MGEITKGEVLRSIRSLKNVKAGGVDKIPPEAFKARDNVSAEALLKLLKQIWNEEEIPTDWKKGIIAKLLKKGDLSQCGNWRGITLLTIASKKRSFWIELRAPWMPDFATNRQYSGKNDPAQTKSPC